MSKEEQKPLRAADYVREHTIEQRLEEFIGQVVHGRPADPYGVLANEFAKQSQAPTIAELVGREVLCSSGLPTLQVDVYAFSLGRKRLVASFQSPIGISQAMQEQKPLFDTNSTRFFGFGCRGACSLIEVLSLALQGSNFTTVDQYDIIIKKTMEGKSNISNVLAGTSFALAKASAMILQQQPFMYLYESLFPQQAADHFVMPTPAITVIDGGMHAASALEFEALFLIPKQTISFLEQLRTSAEVFYRLKTKLYEENKVYQIGKTGGFVTDSSVVASAVFLIERAIVEAGFQPGVDFTIGINCGASSFYNNETQKYCVEKGVMKTSAELVQYYIDLITQHPVITLIADGIAELDHTGWELIRDALVGRVRLFGGDIYSSQSILARRGLKKRLTDGIVLQMGQAGTISDTAETARLFKQRGKQIIVERRAGDTEDALLADFAVAIEADLFMGGGLIGVEGVSKYNRLLRIYEYLRDRSMLQ